MRKQVIAGNWKMNKDLSEAKELISSIVEALKGKNLTREVIVCPPFTNLQEASGLIKGSQIKLGAQNLYFEESGAFTGEISASMLKSAGCEYVIIGHSERRGIFGESNELINKKMHKALSSGLKPILCVGESLEQRESGVMQKVIEEEIRTAFEGVSKEELKNVIVAYEPIWAIGTGKTATPEQAQEVHAFIREVVASIYGKDLAEELVIQYGGSVKPSNAALLLSKEDIDGALVGGACLTAKDFSGIILA